VTQDLDFSAILFSSHQNKPSVVLLRTLEALSSAVKARVRAAIETCASELDEGCLVIVDDRRVRVRLLPIE
jgi:predicted nuclease of predicted toxin-antitoxin system